jgi:glycosyltransferase involved in cell wall biosynthesis
MLPPIAVVILVCNGARYLEEDINNVLSQSSPRGKLYLIDDCSTDHSQEIMRLYMRDQVRRFYHSTRQKLKSAFIEASISVHRTKMVPERSRRI